jgi:hypothetical protein
LYRPYRGYQREKAAAAQPPPDLARLVLDGASALEEAAERWGEVNPDALAAKARDLRAALAGAAQPQAEGAPGAGTWVALCNEQSDWGPCDRPKGHDPEWMHCHGAHGWVGIFVPRPSTDKEGAPR